MLEKFMDDLGLTQSELAGLIRVPFQRVNLIVNRRRGITPDTALRLSKLFDMTPEFWLNLQLAWDLWHARRAAEESLTAIQKLRKAG